VTSCVIPLKPWIPSPAVHIKQCIQPKLGLDLHHTLLMCMFSWWPECQMSVWGHHSGLWISLNPKRRGGLCSLKHQTSHYTFSEVNAPISDQSLSLCPKVGPKPRRAPSVLTRSPTSTHGLNVKYNHYWALKGYLTNGWAWFELQTSRGWLQGYLCEI